MASSAPGALRRTDARTARRATATPISSAADEKSARLAHDQQDATDRQRAAGVGRVGRADDHGQDHQTEHVVQHRRAEDDARLVGRATGPGP